MNRLDIFHKFFLVARDNKAFHAPLLNDRRLRIMDLGTGTGIWPINVLEEFAPEAEIMAVDMNQIQPHLVPPCMTVQRFDIEDESWDALLQDCDLIHMRLLFGSIHNDLWPQVYSNVFQHLAPGRGYVEHSEIDWTPHWEGDAVPPRSAFREWSELFLAAMDQYNRSARVVPHETRRKLEAAGFVDIKEEAIRCYVNPWSQNRNEREIARWFNLGFCQGIEAMSLRPMCENSDMTIHQVQDLCNRVTRELCVLKFHAYCTLHVWTAKRPAIGPQ